MRAVCSGGESLSNPYQKEAVLSQIPGLHPLPCTREFLSIPELQEPGPCSTLLAVPSMGEHAWDVAEAGQEGGLNRL